MCFRRVYIVLFTNQNSWAGLISVAFLYHSTCVAGTRVSYSLIGDTLSLCKSCYFLQTLTGMNWLDMAVSANSWKPVMLGIGSSLSLSSRKDNRTPLLPSNLPQPARKLPRSNASPSPALSSGKVWSLPKPSLGDKVSRLHVCMRVRDCVSLGDLKIAILIRHNL